MNMQVNLTTEQAVQVAANAINAASPMGIGFLHHEAKDYTPEEVAEAFGEDGEAHFDYFHGRMTKLTMRKINGSYRFSDSPPDIEYQSWASKYPPPSFWPNSLKVIRPRVTAVIMLCK